MDAAETLVVDVGGHSIKLAQGGDGWRARLPSGLDLTPSLLGERVRAATVGWGYRQVADGKVVWFEVEVD